MSYDKTWYRGVALNTLQFVYGYAYKGLPPDLSQWLIYSPERIGQDARAYRIYNQTLSQSTGRVDKKGRLLFVGDLVRTKYGRICEIIFEDKNYFVGLNLRPRLGTEPIPGPEDMWDSRNLEYVGSIYNEFIKEQREILPSV